MSSNECEYLIALRNDHLIPSDVVDPITGVPVLDNRRTSSGSYYIKSEFINNPVFIKLTTKLEQLTNCPSSNFEDFQILKYEYNQRYDTHYDYFANNQSSHLSRGGQRIKTALLYLNTPTLGGHTYFPHFHTIIAPVSGRLVYWDNTDSEGNPIVQSLHGGMPVLDGVKYVITCWIRESKYS